MNLGHVTFQCNDGGRSKYYKGKEVGDCVVRAISISSGIDYKEVYDELYKRTKEWTSKSKSKKAIKNKGKESPRNGVSPNIYKKYLSELGFIWVPLTSKGTGIQVHLNKDELPNNNKILILRLSRHLTTYCNGVLFDTYDCSRNGNRGVYGYWYKED